MMRVMMWNTRSDAAADAARGYGGGVEVESVTLPIEGVKRCKAVGRGSIGLYTDDSLTLRDRA